jgi:hypothetical protein
VGLGTSFPLCDIIGGFSSTDFQKQQWWRQWWRQCSVWVGRTSNHPRCDFGQVLAFLQLWYSKPRNVLVHPPHHTCFLRQGPTLYPRLVSNLWVSCLGLLIIGAPPHLAPILFSLANLI